MIYTFLKNSSILFIKLFLLVVVLFFSCCSNKTENVGITISNIENNIEEAYIEAEFNDNYEPLVEVIHFIDKNNLKFDESCINVKINIFRSLENYIVGDDYSKMYKFANNAILASENCSENELKVVAYNILGLYYLKNNNFTNAKHNFQLSILFYEENTNHPIIIDSYYNLADIQVATKDWQKVLETTSKGISLLKNIEGKQSRLKYFYIFKTKAHIYLNEFELAEKIIKDTLNNGVILENNMLQEEIDKFYKEIYAVKAELNLKKGNYKLAYKYSQLEDSLFSKQLSNTNNKAKDLLIIKNQLTNDLYNSNIKIVNRQKIILVGTIAFLLFTLVYLYRIYSVQKRLKLTLKEKEKLNNKLNNNFQELDKAHKKSSLRKAEIESLLKFNEQTLLTKTLKISNYKDAVRNIIIKINKLIESNESIKSATMHSVNRALQNIISEEEFWEDFKIEFEKNRPNFFNILLKRNATLSISEQKHCAYVAINLKSKEVANILNLSPRSVETTRYRIKKKLNLEKQSLQDFLKEL